MNESVAVPERLVKRFNGRLISPEDARYEAARTVFYSGFDRRPAAIVRAADATDVAAVVEIAGETGSELAIRSGGHSVAGHSASHGGIVLDLSNMRALEIDAEAHRAWVQTGLSAGDYTAATGAYGLATGFGDAGSVGIGGITLGGGIGYLLRKHGLTIDDLLAAEVVTADGRLRHVDAENHPDLFWAIRGGGGNFGVATRFQFRLHEVGTVLGGVLMLPANADLIASLVALAEAAPEELSIIANVMPAPAAPFVPAEDHGRLVAMASLVYAGPIADGVRAVAPLRALATPIADTVRPMRYPELYPRTEAGHLPVVVTRSLFVDTFDKAAAETILEQIRTSTAEMRKAELRVLGGAMARVPAEATAFAHRKRRVIVSVAAVCKRPEDAPIHERWVSGLAAALRRGEPGVYVNFLGDEGQERVREAYPGPTWDRLVEIKSRYDPTNLFRLNQNIPPASNGPATAARQAA